MLIEIQGLKMPASIDGTAELFAQEVSRRTVGGRLIAKVQAENWRITVSYETTLLSPEFQAAFYNICTVAKRTPVVIKFISPYTNALTEIQAICVTRQIPKIMAIGSNNLPKLYSKAGAVFESVNQDLEDLPIVPKTITENGTYLASGDNAIGYNPIVVDVHRKKTSKTITENGSYLASDDNVDGYDIVVADIHTPDQVKSVTPTEIEQIVVPDAGYLLSKVQVKPIPQRYKNTDGADVVPENIVAGKKAVGVDGLIVGTMTDNGEQNAILTTDNKARTIPAGYTKGGVVSINTESKDVTLKAAGQVVTPSAGKVLESVNIPAIANLASENIKEGVQILDVTGTFQGGGGSEEGAIKVKFHYINEDGENVTAIKACDVGGSVTPPTIGDVPEISDICPELTFQGWNYTLEELTNIQNNMEVGAMYIPTDGCSYFYIEVTKTTGHNVADALLQTIYLRNEDSNPIYVNWGDGSPTNTVSGTGSVNQPHTYSKTGSYVVKVWKSSGAYSLGGCTSTSDGLANGIFRDGRQPILKKCFVGNNVIGIDIVCFSGCYSLNLITIPNSVTSIGSGAFSSCQSLQSIVIPNSVTSIDTNVFSSCQSLQSIVIPNSVTSIGSGAFFNCSSPKSVKILGAVTSVGTVSFNNNPSILEYDFRYCTSVPTLVGVNAFVGINPICTIKVPQSLYSQWITATNWATYANYIVGV